MNPTSAVAPATTPPATSDAPTTPGSTPAGSTPRRGLRILSILGPVVALMVATFVPVYLLGLLLPPLGNDTPAGTVALAVLASPSSSAWPPSACARRCCVSTVSDSATPASAGHGSACRVC